MYTKRAMLASDATKQQKLAQSATLMGRTYVPPIAVVPHKAKGINPLAALGRDLAANPKAAYPAAPKADLKAKSVQPKGGRARSVPAP
eukprot:2708487-Heterocapsa_arctica.AAC.1